MSNVRVWLVGFFGMVAIVLSGVGLPWLIGFVLGHLGEQLPVEVKGSVCAVLRCVAPGISFADVWRSGVRSGF